MLFLERHTVDADRVSTKLRNLSEPELDELSQFGSMMVDEIVGRLQQIESKATVILGYDGAIFAFLLTLLSHPLYTQALPSKITLFVAALATIGSGVAATYIIMARFGWAWPSEEDWFPEKAFGNLNAIKRRHIHVLLYAHQQQGLRADQKGFALIYAQWLLVGALAALVILFSIGFITLYYSAGVNT